MTAPLSKDLIRDLFDYADGKLFWRKSRGTRGVAGAVAGCAPIKSHAYHRVVINRRVMYRHRLVWVWHNGAIPDGLVVDHINGDTTDDRIENLRLATHRQNACNRKVHTNNKSGYKGVDYVPQFGGFRAVIYVDGKQRHLGIFDSPEKAHQAYIAASEEYYGDYSRSS